MTDLSIVAIIPLYNGQKWIEGAIRSVFAQTLHPDEFVVVDDGSTDGGAGAAIVERLAQERPIKLLRKENGGQSSARNFGVRHSTSALIALLDQDDEWYPNHLEELVKPFQNATDIPLGWAYSDVAEIDAAGSMMRHSILTDSGTPHPKSTLVGCLSRDMFILPSASLVRREAFEAIGGFDERLCGYEDDDLFLRMFRAGYGDCFLKRSLSAWRSHAESTSHSEHMAKSRRIYVKKLIDLYPDDRHRNLHYRKHCIAPRFLNSNLAAYSQAFRVKNTNQMRARVDDIRTLFPYFSIRMRIALSIITPFMRSYLIVFMASRLPHFLRTALTRFAGLH